MANVFKQRLLTELTGRFGELKKLARSQSLFVIGEDAARIYVRYSRMHAGSHAFFGLRAIDLHQLEAHNSFICFVVDNDSSPVFVPYSDFEEIFQSLEPASDGQYKVHLYLPEDARELYIPRQGRFNVEGYVGFDTVSRSLDSALVRRGQPLSHSQVQTLLAGIGHAKGYGVYVPRSDAGNLDWSLTEKFPLSVEVPAVRRDAERIVSEIDVVWLTSAGERISGLFEVEHSTPIYSGLLRFNDVFLTESGLSRFVVVSNDARRSLFARQVLRPTFRKSGLGDLVSFLDYANVVAWHRRVVAEPSPV